VSSARRGHVGRLPWIAAELPITEGTVQRLMKIAQHSALANTAHALYFASSAALSAGGQQITHMCEIVITLITNIRPPPASETPKP
jgi:hypothetical protein